MGPIKDSGILCVERYCLASQFVCCYIWYMVSLCNQLSLTRSVVWASLQPITTNWSQVLELQLWTTTSTTMLIYGESWSYVSIFVRENVGKYSGAYRVYPSISLNEDIKKRKLLLLSSPPWFLWNQEVGQIRKLGKQCGNTPFA